jgi:dolichyl-phosphate-mannose-protein mannosyltransferase
MLLGLAGAFVGYDGSFEFESGKQYPAHVHYTGMRVFAAAFGALTVPLGYYTGVELKLSKNACIFLACMVLFGEIYYYWASFAPSPSKPKILLINLLDTALLTISRFILLDSLLLFFTATSAYTLCKFRNLQVTE